MSHGNGSFDDISDRDMSDLLARTVRRGTQIRRQRLAVRTCLVVLVVVIVAVPLSLSISGQPDHSTNAVGPSGSARGAASSPGSASSSARSLVTTSAGPFRMVVWMEYFNPSLNVKSVQFPGGACNPDSRSPFRIEVQQVSYIRIREASSPIAVALVRCNSGSTGPSSLYTFTFDQGSDQPLLLQTLLAPPHMQELIWQATHFVVSNDAIVLPAEGATGSAGECCPNVVEYMRWVLRGDHFIQVKEPIRRIGGSSSS
jgi:hypothetical protein